MPDRLSQPAALAVSYADSLPDYPPGLLEAQAEVRAEIVRNTTSERSMTEVELCRPASVILHEEG